MITTPTRSPVNSVPLVGNVPGPGGTVFLLSMEPAIPSTGTIIRKRPASIVMPSVTFHHGVFALSPANAEPLLPAPLVNAYRISVRPCGPPLASDDVPYLATADHAEKPRMISGKTRTYSMDSF